MRRLNLRINIKGFTIIELMIVLAIAGLIILIVLLAVPALQRNSRNTARKTDATYMVDAIFDYNSSIVTSSTALPPGGYDCSPPLTGKLFCKYVEGHLSYYDLSNVLFHSNQHTPPASPPAVTNPNKILLDTFARCNDDGTATSVGASVKSTVVLYEIETKDGPVPQCIDTTVNTRAP
jgi:prepilin-type N-terminal cleavage/methylation domain-containing protein